MNLLLPLIHISEHKRLRGILNQIVDYLQNNSSNVVKNHYSNMKNGIREALNIFECGDIEKLNTGRKVYYRIMDGSTKYLNMNKRQLRS